MEKKLLYGAIALFILELGVFLADLGYLPMPLFESQEVKTRQPVIGFVKQTRETVRKKSVDSIFWQSAANKDTLSAYDSVLTLENSAAELELENDIRLNLNGNTLVVLEPVEKDGQKRFRIQFQKGNLRSRSIKQQVTMKTSDWVLEASKGTDVSVTQLEDQQIQVEVLKGQAKVNHSKSRSKAAVVASGSRVSLSRESVESTVTIDKSLKWKSKTNQWVKYSHEFPAPVNLSWEGPANRLRFLKPGQNPQIRELDESHNGQWSGSLEPGTWFVTAETDNATSPTLMLKVLPTAKLRHLSPLPRDRNDAAAEISFAWLKHPDVKEYELQVSDTREFSNVLESYKTTETGFQTRLESTGLMYWRVQGKDSNGYKVPAFYIYPLYNIKDPLAPPQLRPPLQRRPAEKNKKGASLFRHFMNWLIPSAHAEEETPALKSNTRKTVIFSWYEVPDADYYVIEISVSKDFLSPMVVKKVTKTEFAWSDFESNTYYYRVAAGQSNGRMGLFSAPEEVNLSLLSTETASRELKPGVRLSIEKIKQEIKKDQRKESPSPEEVSFQNGNVVRAGPGGEKPVALKRQEMKVTGSLFWSGGYIVNSHSSKNDVTANQNGFSARRLGLGLTLPLHKRGHLALHSEYNENKWQPDQDKLPFQESLTQTHWFHSIMYAPQGSPSPYGLFYESIGIANRTGNESLKLKDTEFYGILTKTGYQFFASWNSRHTLGVGYGDPFFILHSDNYVFYDLDFWGENTGNTGLEFNIKYGQGSSGLNFIYSQIMYRLGFEF